MAVQPPDAPLARAESRPVQPSEQPLRPPAAPVAPADPWALTWWSEHHARGLIEHAPDIISRFDRHLRHVYVNPAVERATGLPRAHFIGKDHAALGMPADVVAHFQDVLRRGDVARPSVGGRSHVPRRHAAWARTSVTF